MNNDSMSEHIYIYTYPYVYVQLSFVFFLQEGKLKKKQKTNLRETQNVKKKEALRGYRPAITHHIVDDRHQKYHRHVLSCLFFLSLFLSLFLISIRSCYKREKWKKMVPSRKKNLNNNNLRLPLRV